MQAAGAIVARMAHRRSGLTKARNFSNQRTYVAIIAEHVQRKAADWKKTRIAAAATADFPDITTGGNSRP